MYTRHADDAEVEPNLVPEALTPLLRSEGE